MKTLCKEGAVGGRATLPSELIGRDVNRQEFVSEYMKLLDTGLSILGNDGRLPEWKILVLKTFLVEGYDSLLKKYKKTRFMFPDTWMKKKLKEAYGYE
jgi:hypothetical protein